MVTSQKINDQYPELKEGLHDLDFPKVLIHLTPLSQLNRKFTQLKSIKNLNPKTPKTLITSLITQNINKFSLLPLYQTIYQLIQTLIYSSKHKPYTLKEIIKSTLLGISNKIKHLTPDSILFPFNLITHNHITISL